MNHYNSLRSDIKENQKKLIKIWTVDEPIKEYERTYDLDGKTRGNKFILNTFRYGNYQGGDTYNSRGDPKGTTIRNWGSFREDPRKGNRKAPTNSYCRKFAATRRDKYIGPYSPTDQTNDYNPYETDGIIKFKGYRGRKMVFRRGTTMVETINEESKRTPQFFGKKPNFEIKDNIAELERYDRTLTRTSSYNTNPRRKRLEQKNDIVVDSMTNINNRRKYQVIKDNKRLNPSSDLILQDEKKTDQVIRAPLKGLDNKRYYSENNISNRVKDSDILNNKIYSLNKREVVNYVKLMNKNLERYESEKIYSNLRSSVLTNEQDSLIKELRKEGHNEKDCVQILQKVNQEIIRNINSRDFRNDKHSIDSVIKNSVKSYLRGNITDRIINIIERDIEEELINNYDPSLRKHFNPKSMTRNIKYDTFREDIYDVNTIGSINKNNFDTNNNVNQHVSTSSRTIKSHIGDFRGKRIDTSTNKNNWSFDNREVRDINFNINKKSTSQYGISSNKNFGSRVK